jgi:hypothetical protein
MLRDSEFWEKRLRKLLEMKYGNKKVPSEKEVLDFVRSEAKPYKFAYTVEPQPLRVSSEQGIIFVNKGVLIDSITLTVKGGLDWKENLRIMIMHEKAHEKFSHWEYEWGVGSMDYGGLPNVLQDLLIDKIHFAEDKAYQKVWLENSRLAYHNTLDLIRDLFPTTDEIPHMLYNQAAYWITLGAISIDEAASLYPEKADYVVQISHLLNKIKCEKDLEWAWPEAKRIYLRNFQI